MQTSGLAARPRRRPVALRFKRAIMSLLLATGCGGSRHLVGQAPAEPYDVAVVPGCPTLQDGAPSRCLIGRAGWAALLYQKGYVRRLITSGGAVQTPYVEAEMLAAILESLGVPADRIIVDPHALHTDENMYNAAQISKALGYRRLAVASDPLQARWGCRMMSDWGVQCDGFAMDIPSLTTFLAPHEAQLTALRVRQVNDFVPLAQREAEREKRTGRRRPASFLLYPMLGYLAWIGKPWVPITPMAQASGTWADHRRSAP